MKTSDRLLIKLDH